MRSSRLRKNVSSALTVLALLALPVSVASAQDDDGPPVVEDPLAPPAPTEDRRPVPPPADDDGAPPRSREPEGLLPPTLLGWTPVAELYDEAVAWKDQYIPLTIGAWHWYHVRQSGPLASDYGIPGLRGTYYYYAVFSPELATTNKNFDKVGAHVDFRWRDDEDQFRSFFESNYWLWEAYGWVDTPVGRLKGGKIWKRFGLDWDGSWWGNAAYFDGQKLDPDIGVSLEETWTISNTFTVDTFAQYFFREDRVNGSLAGADPESNRHANERDTGVVRVVPTIVFGGLKLALGLSGMAGRVVNRRTNGATTGVDDEIIGAAAADLTASYGPFKVFGEISHSWGVITPVHYVSGGPSNQRATALLGAHYTIGFATLRATYSMGWDDNPDGRQGLAVVGTTLAVTKHVDIMLEYVRWDVHNAEGDDYALLEDGYQVLLNWRF
jgi:hypothetical protein